MVTFVAEDGERDLLLGEIEAEIVGMQYHNAGIRAGEQINVERESKNAHARRAIRVENGHFEPVGVKFVLPVSCVEAGRWRYQSRHFESKFCAPPSLRNKKLKSVLRSRAEGGAPISDQGEVWDEVRKCLADVNARSETASLTDGFVHAEETLKEHCKRMVLPEGATGVLVGRNDRIIGMDLFDAPSTLKTLWGRLSDAYFFDALRNPAAAPPTPADKAQRFVERLGSAARPRVPALSLGEEMEITREGLVGAVLMYDGGICHLAAFSDGA